MACDDVVHSKLCSGLGLGSLNVATTSVLMSLHPREWELIWMVWGVGGGGHCYNLLYLACHVYLQLLKLAQEPANQKSGSPVIMSHVSLYISPSSLSFHCLLSGTVHRPFYVAIPRMPRRGLGIQNWKRDSGVSDQQSFLASFTSPVRFLSVCFLFSLRHFTSSCHYADRGLPLQSSWVLFSLYRRGFKKKKSN